MFWRRRKERELAAAREEALRWYERLGGQIASPPGGDQLAAKQALADAGERYNAAGAQLDRADSARRYELARETALEGLAYIRAARTAAGLGPGPAIPPLAARRGVGSITQERRVDVDGREFRASPRPAGDTPHYYPGGRVQGRPVLAGWYSEPWWKTALAGGALVVGGLPLFDVLAAGFGGYDGYREGYDRGGDQDHDEGGDPGAGDDTGYDGGGVGGGDF